MASTFFGLSIGKSGMYASQASLNTTAHNVSNATTAGYTRQVVTQEASAPIALYSRAGMAGTGVDVTNVDRVRNIYYDEKYRDCNTAYGNYNTKDYYLNSIQSYFSETNSEGLTATYTEFCMALKNLKNNVSDSTMRTEVAEKAENLTDYVQSLANSLQTIQREANVDIKTTVDRINSIAAQIATLNKQINTLELRGSSANDLRDKRDLLVDELSEYANISVTETSRGDELTLLNEYTIKLDGKTLVDTYHYNSLITTAKETNVNQNDIDGLYDVTWSDGQDFNSASISLGGKLQALFEIRDGNNKANFKGTAQGGNEGDDTLTVVDTSCNNINKLNIPEQDGELKVGNRMYYYDYFEVNITEDGAYEYTFYGIKDENENVGLKVDSDGKNVSIGTSIAYKGIPYYQAQLNEFVRTYATQFNTVHNGGEDLRGENGLDLFNGVCAVTGHNFNLDEDLMDENGDYTGFSSVIETDPASGEIIYNSDGKTVNGSYYNLTALNFSINTDILDDPLKLACAEDLDNGVDECTFLDKLIALQDNADMFKEGTPAQFLHSFTANISIDTEQATLFATSQSNILSSIDTQRMEISSVDEDEEAMNLVKYQNIYELSCKVVSVMDEIYDKLINGTGA